MGPNCSLCVPELACPGTWPGEAENAKFCDWEKAGPHLSLNISRRYSSAFKEMSALSYRESREAELTIQTIDLETISVSALWKDD